MLRCPLGFLRLVVVVPLFFLGQADAFAFVRWYLAVSVGGLVALPLGHKLFRFLPDRGYAFARTLGLLFIGYVFWLLGSFGFLRNDAPGLLIAAAIVLGLGLAWLKRAGLTELWGWLKDNQGYVWNVEALFFLAFALWAWVRAYNPEIEGTEKPMEFMFINAILRSPTFPPKDAWLAGHAISYYYFGYVMIAALTKVTGVASAVAFNLGIALLFALTATGALGVTANLIAVASPPASPPLARLLSAALRAQERGQGVRSAFWPALLGPLCVLFAGNFYGLLRIAHANGLFADLQIPAVRYDFGAPGNPDPNQPPQGLNGFDPPPGVRAESVNVWTWLDLKGMDTPPGPPPAQPVWDPGFWWWFNGARVTHDRNLTGAVEEAITEMPAFSFVLGDMHPHVLSLPFVFIAIGLALNWLMWGQSQHLVEEGVALLTGVRALLQSLIPNVLFSAIVLGGLSFLNTWDFPIYVFVNVAALAVGLGLAWGWDELIRRWAVLAAFAGVFMAGGIVLYLPFYFTFQSQAGGLLPNLIYPTRFQQTVVMFAHVLIGAVLFVGWLAAREWRGLDRRAALWAGGGIVVALVIVISVLSFAATFNDELANAAERGVAPLTLNEAFNLMLQRRIVDSFTTLVPALMIGLAVGLGVGVLRRAVPLSFEADEQAQPAEVAEVVGAAPAVVQTTSSNLPPEGRPTSNLQSPAVLLSLVMLLTGALLLLGPEYVYLRDFFGTRMNTIFKFYFQTWVLWGLATAFGVWYITQRARPVVWASVSIVMGIAILASLVYTFAAVCSKANPICDAERRATATPTLNGMSRFAEIFPNDWAAAQWLRDNVSGTPVIAEAVGGSYSSFGRIAMATGLPTVMGWDFHEQQWRGRYFAENLAGRPGDVQNIYVDRDWANTQKLLDDYGVEYVILGGLERQQYRGLYQPKFDQFMRPVAQFGDLTIYQRLGVSGN